MGAWCVAHYRVAAGRIARIEQHDCYEQPTLPNLGEHASADPLCQERRCQHRLPGHRRRARDLVLVPGFVSHLEFDWDDPRSRAFPRPARLVHSADPLRQARHGTLRPARRAARPRDPDGRRPRRHGRRWQRARGAFGYSEGGPMSILFAATQPERVERAGPLRRVREAAALRPTIRGRRPRRSGDAYATRLRRSGRFEADMRRMCPSADEAMARWWERARGPPPAPAPPGPWSR